MEDMARLALLEQSLRDSETFGKILCELLDHIHKILENPHDNELRTIKSDVLSNMLQHEVFIDYLNHVGFQLTGNNFAYPKQQPLSKLRVAQAAIERKIYFCCGTINHHQVEVKSGHRGVQIKKHILTNLNILTTNNSFLRRLQNLFNNMLVYESEELQELARKCIPMVTLQLMALDRMREYQKKVKTGEIKGADLPFDIALLMELLGWFKHKFFSWVDKPECSRCCGSTSHVGNTTMTTETESCRVELYRCSQCSATTQFPRYNDPRTLLRTRRGRCGEWANAFTLLCRALGYDTRYVYDTSDHVWCEVFDYDSNVWLHVDPCEAKLNVPLMYCHGWGKQLSYVIAVSKDDLQDVTWRYTTDHKEVLKRRNLCSEEDLVTTILQLREHRQRQVSEPRRKYLAKRTLQELIELMVERKPSDYESHGRISGSKEWRTARGEVGLDKYGHTFRFTKPGKHCIRYFTAADKYVVTCDGCEQDVVEDWSKGVYECKNIFRKVENDWRMTYLAREEGEPTGSISWKFAAEGNIVFTSLSIRLSSAIYENGCIDWTIKFDDEDPVPTKLGETSTCYTRVFKQAVIAGALSGGLGDVAWQHAQLFRQRTDTLANTLDVQLAAEANNY